MKMKIIILLIVAIGALFYFFWHFNWPVWVKKVDPQSMRNIDGGLGLHGEDMGYVWATPPKGVKVGDLLSVAYNDGNNSFKSTCLFSQSEPSFFFVDGVKKDSPIDYYCEATWPKDLPSEKGYDKSNYTFVDKLTIQRILDRLKN